MTAKAKIAAAQPVGERNKAGAAQPVDRRKPATAAQRPKRLKSATTASATLPFAQEEPGSLPNHLAAASPEWKKFYAAVMQEFR